MSVIKARIIADGRIALPAEIRRRMQIGEGDIVHLRLKGDELCIRSAGAALRDVQQRMRAYLPDGDTPSDGLIAERRGALGDE